MKRSDNKLLQAIVKINKVTKDKNEEGLLLIKKYKATKLLADELNCTSDEAVIFALIFNLNVENHGGPYAASISEHLGIPPIDFLQYQYLINNLIQKQLLRQNNISYRTMQQYLVPQKIYNRIICENIENLINIETSHDLLFCIDKELESFFNQETTQDTLSLLLEALFKENENIHFAQKIIRLNIHSYELILLLYIIKEFNAGEEEVGLNIALQKIFWEETPVRYNLKRNILRQNSVLFKQKIIDTGKCYWKNDVDIKLTQEGAEYLFGEEADLIMMPKNKKKKKDNIFEHQDIKVKKLFYTDKDNRQIDFLQNTLQNDNLLEIQNRLITGHMTKGITILLYGQAGTGKTETVMQLARSTGRNIYRVDISSTKSMWFGESEKMAKEIFENYKKYAKNQETTPIFLFNEADAVLAKRKDKNSSAIDQTENAIQNIFLQELEEFEGILIATTNLANNLDKAFERRFLFKIELGKPDANTRELILKDNMPFITEQDIRYLSENYEFSGGVIQNIVRKSTMYHVMNGAYPSLDWLIEECNNEKMQSDQITKIGFKR